MPEIVPARVYRSCWIMKMGAVATIPPQARNAAAPDGAPPRRISKEKTALAPPCPVRDPEAGWYRFDL